MKRQTARLGSARLGTSLLGSALLATGLVTPAAASEEGGWLIKAVTHDVLPRPGNSDIANADDDFSLDFSSSHLFTDRFAIELLAALPFSHGIELRDGGSPMGQTRHQPPVRSALSHYPMTAATRAYFGAGPLYSADLELDDSFGIALQLGADFDISDSWFLNVDVRYIDIETSATLAKTDLTVVEIEPWIVDFTLAAVASSRCPASPTSPAGRQSAFTGLATGCYSGM